jgi:homoserine O-acetyltransferase
MIPGITQLTQVFDAANPLRLENGYYLYPVTVAYETHGRLNSDGSNAILICHALTGDAHVAGEGVYNEELLSAVPHLRAMKTGQPGWWDGMIGPGKTFDPARYFIICSNILGSCYGTTGPASIDPASGQSYRTTFPEVSVRDMIRVQYALLKKLGVNKIHTITGGSLGGMQVMEWAVMYPEMVKSIIPIATSVQHSAWCIGLNHLARQAILNDPVWQQGQYDTQPFRGLSLARQIGMVSYRADLIFNSRFAREQVNSIAPGSTEQHLFQVESYLSYQGEKLVKRFDANTFLYLSRAMDQHDLARGRGTLAEVLGSIRAKTLCLGIDTDILYPAHEQRSTSSQIRHSVYREIKSIYGHDAFLIEFEQLSKIIKPFLEEKVEQSK